jgi:hypothetical protein
MAIPQQVRVPLEDDDMMHLYQPALGESLDVIEKTGERILLHGLAHVGNCDGYYLITDQGVHYCDSEKMGFLKKRYVSRFYPRAHMAHAVVDQIAGPRNAYLRIFEDDDSMNLVFWFNEEPWQDAPSLVQAEAAARALGFA